jgi:hypothetical protein
MTSTVRNIHQSIPFVPTRTMAGKNRNNLWKAQMSSTQGEMGETKAWGWNMQVASRRLRIRSRRQIPIDAEIDILKFCSSLPPTNNYTARLPILVNTTPSRYHTSSSPLREDDKIFHDPRHPLAQARKADKQPDTRNVQTR